MRLDFNSELPIYLQITAEMEDAIFTGAFPEEIQVPSTTEISASMQVNPATVLKGMNLLVDEGLLYKKRGLGLFVKEGAAEKIKQKRQQQFYEKYVVSLVKEARKLKLTREEIMEWMERGFAQ
jgi:DNA-binding transcriptional regulator YhcF (GntR family)